MEIALLTGANLMITMFEKDEGKIINYMSDPIETFIEIANLKEVYIKKKYFKDKSDLI
jgi:hypothetical protein